MNVRFSLAKTSATIAAFAMLNVGGMLIAAAD